MAKIGFVSLGCPKNLVDSEVMLGFLSQAGHQIVSVQEEAEILVVNTCGFIESAKQESVDTILEMAQQKISGKCRRLIVAGCLVERYRDDIRERIPEVDAVIGIGELPQIVQLCSEEEETSPPRYELRELYLYSDSDPRILSTSRHSAYIKIAEGCNHPCTFCVIPQMRGRFRSRPIDSILAEASNLIAGGVKEINLVGQDTTMYGWDWGNRQGLAELIRRLGEMEGIQWVRFLYAYPNHVYDELLAAIAETPAACKYIDIPLQHGSGRMLKLMKRGGNRASLTRLLERVRTIPEVAIRTTMIVGFPGETDADFREVMDFVSEAQFDRLGVFTYSDEEDAVSHGFKNKVPEAVKKERQGRLMKLQSNISRKKNRELIGNILPVLIEGVSKESELLWEGRLSTQAPEVDGVVYLNDGTNEKVNLGDIMPVRITEAHDYDLVGTIMS